MSKHIVIKLSDDIYEELEKRAKEEGFLLVSDYIRELISRELGKRPFNPRIIEARLEKLEMGELPPRLYDSIARIVEETLASKLPEVISSISEGEMPSISEDKVLEKIARKLEREVQRELIPWTQKIDEIARKLADLKEEVEKLKDEINEIKEARKSFEKEPQRSHSYQPQQYYEQRYEKRERRSTAIDRLKRQGAVFEDELRSIRSKDYFFAKLKSSGAIVLQTQRHGRIAVHPEAWQEFLRVLEESESGNEEEVLEKLDNEGLRKLFEALRNEGDQIYDSGTRSWKHIEDIEWK